MDKKCLIIANWKANKTVQEARIWGQEYSKLTDKIREKFDKVEIAVAPPNTLLHFFEGSHFTFVC